MTADLAQRTVALEKAVGITPPKRLVSLKANPLLNGMFIKPDKTKKKMLDLPDDDSD